MTPTTPPDLDPETRRALAIGLYNHAWTLIDLDARTAEQDDEMLHAAHASRFHWGEIATGIHRARGEWQCARVYAVLGRAEPALWHARRCLELVEAAPDREDWDLAAAYEALARASLVAGDGEAAADWKARATAALDAIGDEDDREPIERDLATLP